MIRRTVILLVIIGSFYFSDLRAQTAASIHELSPKRASKVYTQTPVREGSLWNSTGAHVLKGFKDSITVTLTQQTKLEGFLLQADNNDTYFIEGTSDGKTWKRLWNAPPVYSKEGLRTRATKITESNSFIKVRVRAASGDGSYSVSHFMPYTEVPKNWKALTQYHESPLLSVRSRLLKEGLGKRITALIALILAALLITSPKKNGFPYQALRLSFLVVGLFSIALWWELFTYHSGKYLHTWDFGHYYIGAKYFPELGYDKMYTCMAVADSEDSPTRQNVNDTIRDLETNALVPIRQILEKKSLCKSAFREPRWQQFRSDITWFRNSMTPSRWASFKRDHGFNAPPGWLVLALTLIGDEPINEKVVKTLSHIDTVLIIIMWVVLYFVFGIEAATIAAVFWGTNYPARFFWNGGSLLRYDWLVWMVLSVCALKKKQFFASGFLIGITTQLRIFPGFILLGSALHILTQLWREKTLLPKKEYRSFILGGIISIIWLVPLSFLVSERNNPYQEFITNSQKHLSTPLTNHMGLQTVLGFDPSSRGEMLKDPLALDPYADWKEDKKETFQDRALLYYGIIAALFALFVAKVPGAEPWQALALGTIFIPFLTELTCYYYCCLLILGLLWSRAPIVGLLLPAAALLTWMISELFSWYDESFVWQSLVILVISALLLVAFNPSKQPLTKSSL